MYVSANFSGSEAVVWDWNGTLLNDLALSIGAMNLMLEKRGFPLLQPDRYREIFTFPVRDYYTAAGFDFEKHHWDTVAMEFIDNYRKGVTDTQLHDGAVDVLNYLKNRGYRQFILSAMQQDFLEETVFGRLDAGLFEQVVGLNNHYAATKAENARLLVKHLGLEPEKIVMVGDTLHDHEVAVEAGMRSILVCDGHQSKARLLASGAPVVNRLQDLKALF